MERKKISEIEKYKRDIAVILESNPDYRDVDINEELLSKIFHSLKMKEAKIDEIIEELKKIPPHYNPGPFYIK